MKGGETHVYHLNLAASQFLHAVVDQRGIDVVVKLFAPGGKQVFQVDSPNGTQGPEPVWVIAEASGSYRLEVRSLEKDAKPGRYEVRTEELRMASERDRTRVAAERVAIEAELLLAQGSKESLRKAAEKFKESLQLRRAAEDQSGEARTLNSIGATYDLLGEKPEALEHFNQALAISRAAGDRADEAITLNNIAALHRTMDEEQKALDFYSQALAIIQTLPGRPDEATTLYHIGAIYNSLGDKQKTLDYFNRALSASRAAGDPMDEASILHNTADVCYSIGKKQEALEYYERALAIERTLPNRLAEAVTLINLGLTNNDLGEKQKALDYYHQALWLFRAAGYSRGEAWTLNNIGLTYHSLGEEQKAIEYYSQALALFRATEGCPGESVVLTNLGQVYASLGEWQRSLDYYNQALPIIRAEGDRKVEAATLTSLGAVHSSLGDIRKALDYYNQALRLHRALGDRADEAITLIHVGSASNSLGEKQKALDSYNQALQMTRSVGDRPGEVSVLMHIGIFYESLGEKQKAFDFYQQAINKVESLKASATIEEIKTSLSGDSAAIYRQAILLLSQQSRYIEAYNLTERARARTFLDQMGNVRPHQHNTTKPQLIQEEQTLASELTLLEQSLTQERSKPASSSQANELSLIENQLATERRRYEDLLLRLKLTNPEYTSLRSVNPLTLSEAQRLLDNDTTLITYFVTPEKTLAFLITRSGFRAVELPVKETDLTNSINWFRGFANLRNPQPESLKQLYGWLIDPLRPHIKTRTIGIIPHGILNYLPFAALTDGEHYFGDEHTVFYLPSASVLPFIQKKSKPVGTQMLAIAQSQAKGLPALQYADGEAETVASVYGLKALTTSAASKSELLKRAGEYSIIHIAAHAELNTSSPLFSRIRLGAGKDDAGALEVREVYDLDLSKASLVVLSACETQLGRQSKGDDIVGLNRAFIYAGTPTVIASLWTVDDESTSYLMKSFYIHLKSGMRKAAALQAAQSDARKKYLHPYYWAGFVLTGDPGLTTSVKAGRN